MALHVSSNSGDALLCMKTRDAAIHTQTPITRRGSLTPELRTSDLLRRRKAILADGGFKSDEEIPICAGGL